MEAIIWYASWPVLIFVTWRFVWLNIQHNEKMERLAMYEQIATDSSHPDKTT